jgi:hypothetical protein
MISIALPSFSLALQIFFSKTDQEMRKPYRQALSGLDIRQGMLLSTIKTTRIDILLGREEEEKGVEKDVNDHVTRSNPVSQRLTTKLIIYLVHRFDDIR